MLKYIINNLYFFTLPDRSTRMEADSDLSFLSENMQKPKAKIDSPEVYVIPKYDFDKIVEIEGPPDIDEVTKTFQT